MAGSIFAGKKGIIIPVALGIIAVLLSYQWLRQKERQLLLRGQPVPVLVAMKDIPRMTRIGPELVKVQAVPRQFLQPGALTAVKEAVGQVTISPVLKGEQVLGTKLVSPGVETGLAIKVPKGMRAVTVATDEVSGVAGLIQPGNYVDVLGVFEFGDGKKSDQKSYTVFQNVLVLAVAQNVGPESDAAKARTMAQIEKAGGVSNLLRRPMAATVTLALTPQQAQGLVLGQSSGRITLSLRSMFEGKEVQTLVPTTLNSMLGIQEKILYTPRPWHEIRGTRMMR